MHCFWIAGIVTQERLRDHDYMSRALIGLHCLPVDKRIGYKMLLYNQLISCGVVPQSAQTLRLASFLILLL